MTFRARFGVRDAVLVVAMSALVVGCGPQGADTNVDRSDGTDPAAPVNDEEPDDDSAAEPADDDGAPDGAAAIAAANACVSLPYNDWEFDEALTVVSEDWPEQWQLVEQVETLRFDQADDAQVWEYDRVYVPWLLPPSDDGVESALVSEKLLDRLRTLEDSRVDIYVASDSFDGHEWLSMAIAVDGDVMGVVNDCGGRNEILEEFAESKGISPAELVVRLISGDEIFDQFEQWERSRLPEEPSGPMEERPLVNASEHEPGKLFVDVDSCSGDPEATVLETSETVTVTASAQTASDDCSDLLVLELDAPLGDRVLIDGATGEPVEVSQLDG